MVRASVGLKAEDLTERKRSNFQKCVETFFCVITWTALGLYLEIYGPTQIDLKIKLKSNYEDVTSGVLGRSVGLFPGSVLGGILVDRFGGYSHLMIAFCLIIAGAVTVPVPLLPSVDYLWPLCFIGGTVEAMINVAGQRIILNIWKEKSAAPMILLHGGYGFGSLLVPLYSNPFLAVKRTAPDTNFTGLYNMTTEFSTDNDTTEYIKDSRIEYSYLISSIPVVLLALPFFVFQIREIKYMRLGKRSSVDKDKLRTQTSVGSEDLHAPRSLKDMVDPASCTGGHRFYGIRLWVLLFLSFANAGGGERMVAGFVRSYSVDQLKFSNSNGSYINTAFWISFLVGRLFFFMLARWVSIRILILLETGGLLIAGILLSVFARYSSMAYWVLVQPLGFFLAPMWPSGVSWTDYHLELTGLGMMVILLGGSVGGTLHQKLIGYLYEHKGPLTFLYQIVGYGALAFTLAVILNLVANRGDRFKSIDIVNVKDNQCRKDEQTKV